LTEEVFNLGRLAVDVDDAGATLLNRRFDPLDAGLGHIASDEPREAIQFLHQALRDASVTGNLEAEWRAHAALGALLASVGERRAAVFHLTMGSSIEKLVETLPDTEYVPVDFGLQSKAPWLRATSWGALGAQADLVPDSEVSRLAELALVDTAGVRQGWSGPQVSLQAWKALEGFARRLTDDLAGRTLDRLRPMIARQTGTYNRNDEEHIAIVAGIFAANPNLRERALAHIVDLLEQGDHVAARMRHAAGRFLVERKEDLDIAGALRPLADAGNQSAIELRYDLGEIDESLLVAVSERVEALLDQPPRPAGQFGIGTDLPRVGYLARVLPTATKERVAEYLMSFAEDRTEPELNRVDALHGLLNLAAELQVDSQRRHLHRCLRLVDDPGGSNEFDHLL
jgi:hypothetical protein